MNSFQLETLFLLVIICETLIHFPLCDFSNVSFGLAINAFIRSNFEGLYTRTNELQLTSKGSLRAEEDKQRHSSALTPRPIDNDVSE